MPLNWLINRPRVRGQVETLLASPDLHAGDARALLQTLRKNPDTTFAELVRIAGEGRKEQLDRVAAVLALLYADELAPMYVGALGSPQPEVAMAVARSLARRHLPDPHLVLRLLEDPDSVKTAVFSVLTGQQEALKPAHVLATASRLTGADRAAVFEMLSKLPTPVAAADLLPWLVSRDADFRLRVVRLLAKSPGGAVADALAKALADPEWRVRLSVLDALAATPRGADIDVLCKCLADPQMDVQRRAIELLSAKTDPTIPRRLSPLLGHESAKVRRAAVEVLSHVATADNIRGLLDAAKDKDWWVRSRSADVLGKIGGPRVVEAAIKLLKDPDAYIRRTAVEILNAAGSAGHFDALAAALNDQDWWVRERAIDGLAATGDPRAVPLLRSLLGRETDDMAQVALIGALARAGGPDIVGDLSRLLKHASVNVRRAVLHAFRAMQEARFSAAIAAAAATLVGDPDVEIRHLASNLQQAGRDAAAGAATPTPTPTPTPPNPMPAPVSAGTAREPGALLDGRYRVIARLGEGAFGAVLLAEDVMVNERVAIKFLHSHLLNDDSVSRRFVKELQLARRISHPGVIRIHDLTRIDGQQAITMEYFPSRQLNSVLAEGPMAPERAVAIAQKVATAMAEAHAAGVVHRDLKPANVLLGEADIPKVVDFGIAAAVSEEATRLTKTGAVVGTPRYMAPEQIRGQRLDGRADVYSLGMILYEMLAGRPPFASGSNPLSVMYQHMRGIKDPPSVHQPGVPPELDRVVMACLATDRDARMASMTALAEALAALPPA